jgi:hypothetical protein
MCFSSRPTSRAIPSAQPAASTTGFLKFMFAILPRTAPGRAGVDKVTTMVANLTGPRTPNELRGKKVIIRFQSGWFDCEEGWPHVAVLRDGQRIMAFRSSMAVHKAIAQVEFEADAVEGDVIETRLYKASPLDRWLHYYRVDPDGSLKELSAEEISQLVM